MNEKLLRELWQLETFQHTSLLLCVEALPDFYYGHPNTRN